MAILKKDPVKEKIIKATTSEEILQILKAQS
jgi:hypothetical protein